MLGLGGEGVRRLGKGWGLWWCGLGGEEDFEGVMGGFGRKTCKKEVGGRNIG